jgi:hypothetical protein
MGAVLLQKKEDGKKHPITYYSKTLSAAEWDYDIYDLCHGSARTPLGTHANGEDSGLEESRKAICT